MLRVRLVKRDDFNDLAGRVTALYVYWPARFCHPEHKTTGAVFIIADIKPNLNIGSIFATPPDHDRPNAPCSNFYSPPSKRYLPPTKSYQLRAISYTVSIKVASTRLNMTAPRATTTSMKAKL